MKARLYTLTFILCLAGSPMALHAGVEYTIEAHAVSSGAREPRGPWIYSGGYFYGTTQLFAGTVTGTIYRYDPLNPQFSILHPFTGGAGGAAPYGLIEASNGLLYGTAYEGANDQGLIFRIDILGNTYEVPRDFVSFSGGGPSEAPIEGSDNKIYGVVRNGGAFSRGGIYRIELDGTSYQLLRAFSGTAGDTPGDGIAGAPCVIEGPAGLLFGVTYLGGANNSGVIYSMTKDGTTYTVLHDFSATGVRNPINRLLLASDGFLYGAAYGGGASGKGGIFRIRPDGTGYQVIHQFANTNDGYDSYQPLIEASDGYLYGVAFYSLSNYGSIFRLPKNGTGFAALHRFASGVDDGAQPDSPLIETAPGVFYGTASSSGSESLGIAFKIVTSFQNPSVKVNGPKKPQFTGSRLVLRGSAIDELGIQRVEYSTGKKWKAARGTSKWSARIRVKRLSQRVKVKVRAIDNDGLISPIAKVRARRALT